MATDSELLDCADRDTVNRVYKQMGRAVIAKTVSIVGRMDIATEIVQDVFLKLFQSENKFPNEKAVYVWLYKSAHNAAIDYFRSARYRRESLTEDYTEYGFADSVNLGESVLSRESVKKYLAMLTKDEADVLVYVAIDEMTHQEAGDLMGVSAKTIQRTMARVRDQIKQYEVKNA